MACRYAILPATVAVSRLLRPASSPILRSGSPFSQKCRSNQLSWKNLRFASSSSRLPEEQPAEESSGPSQDAKSESRALPSSDAVLYASPPLSSSDSIPEEPAVEPSLHTSPIPEYSEATPLSSLSQTSPNSTAHRSSASPLRASLPSNISIPPEVRERLAQWSTTLLAHSRQVVQGAQKKFVELGFKVNEMTGYLEVERLKRLVFDKEDELQKLRENTRAAKAAYDEAVTARSDAQRDLNALLERKHSWTDSDVSRFTTLVRSDHSASHAVASTSIALKEAELSVDKAFSQLMQVILQRYHEEQVWSDKIRSVSTWANIAGLVVNFIVFVGAVLIVEPWKRKRLVEKLEERVTGMMDKVDHRLGGVEEHLKEVVAGVVATTSSKDAVNVLERQVRTQFSEEVKAPLELATASPELSSPALAKELPPTGVVYSQEPISSHPYFTQTIPDLPDYLGPITKASQERDLAIAGLAGAAVAWTIMGLLRLM